MIAMRDEYIATDEDLGSMRLIINSLVAEGKLLVVKDQEIDTFLSSIFVLRKSSG